MSAPSFGPRSGSQNGAIQQIWIGLVLASVVFGCNRMSTRPSEVVTLAIAPQPDVLLVGSSTTLTVTNTQDGSVVQPTWSSTDPTVAIVAAGQLRALHAGVVTIGALYHGTSTSFMVKVVPDYAGTYDGTMFIVECIETVATFCAGAVDGASRFHATWSQTKDTVTGRLFLFNSDSAGQIQGQIDNGGRLAVTGTLASVPSGGVITTLESWSTNLNETGTMMFGTFGMQFTAFSPPRLAATARAELRGVARVP